MDSQKEMKLLLDMYKSAPKEQKDKVQASYTVHLLFRVEEEGIVGNDCPVYAPPLGQ